jgi:hypothetical protein
MTAVPIITQSDPGHENNGVANAQTVIRQTLDASLAGTMQHRFAKGHNNILSEIKWSVFRRDFSPGFENILEEGILKGWYDVNDTIEMYFFFISVTVDSDIDNFCVQLVIPLASIPMASSRDQRVGPVQKPDGPTCRQEQGSSLRNSIPYQSKAASIRWP